MIFEVHTNRLNPQSEFSTTASHLDRCEQLLYEKVSWHHADTYIYTITIDIDTLDTDYTI